MLETQIHAIFLNFLDDLGVSLSSNRFLLAVSGGLDSMVMMELFRQSSSSFDVAHVNFGLRGLESDQDEEFVARYCASHGIPLHVKHVTKVELEAAGGSVQMAARTVRYEWFHKLMNTNSFNFLCLAHHLDDSYETVLYNLTKGTGLRGLTGMAPKREYVLRPLLCLDRSAVFAFAEAKKLEWREDSSNKSLKYMRNRIRHTVVPALREINPSLTETFRSTSLRLRGSAELIDRFLPSLIKNITTNADDDVLIKISSLSEHSLPVRLILLDHILSHFSFAFAEAEEVERLLGAESGKWVGEGEWKVCKERDFLRVCKMSPLPVPVILEGIRGEVEYGKFSFHYESNEKKEWKASGAEFCLELDAHKLERPWVLRHWEQGEKWQPLGLRGKKKVSDFMIDRKIPVTFKQKIPVFSAGGHIAGIPGLGIAEWAKVTEKTQEILTLRYEKSLWQNIYPGRDTAV